MIYPLVRELAGGVPVTVTCRVLNIARQPYYRWLAAPGLGASTEGQGRHARCHLCARAAASGQRVQVAKNRDGQVEALRVLRTTRKTAVRCRRATLQQLHNTIVAAPEEVFERSKRR
jgi:hypothetical protein